MPAQIDPGYPDQPRADVKRNTEFGIPIPKEHRTGESVGGVTRWERRITTTSSKGRLRPIISFIPQTITPVLMKVEVSSLPVSRRSSFP